MAPNHLLGHSNNQQKVKKYQKNYDFSTDNRTVKIYQSTSEKIEFSAVSLDAAYNNITKPNPSYPNLAQPGPTKPDPNKPNLTRMRHQ